MTSQLQHDEIQHIIHELTSPFNDKYDLSFLMEIRRKIRDYKSMDRIEYEFMLQKFNEAFNPIRMEMECELQARSMLYMQTRKIHWIKTIRTWFNNSERLECTLSDAKSLIETFIK